MCNPLVSIITPCYNGEKFVHRFLESVLNQTYTNIELVFVNDGSTDKTEEIVLSYKNKFLDKGMKLIYIYQENSGQAAAINKGLKIFQGEYLTWPDSDDWLHKDSIKRKVEALESDKSYGLVRSNGGFYKEDSLNQQDRRITEDDNRFNEDIFLDLIFERTFCCCGCYMVRRSTFVKVNPMKEILVNQGGQNWQMEIPVAYNNKCKYIDEDLYFILERTGSHCRQERTLEEQIKRNEDLCKIQVWAIEQAKCRDKELIGKVKYKFISRNMLLGYKNRNKLIVSEAYQQLNQIGRLKTKEKLLYYSSKSRYMMNTIEFIVKALRIFKKVVAG